MKRIKHEIEVPNVIEFYRCLFEKAGKKLYLVGGCVRDRFMGVDPKDYDLATDAVPDETIRILKDSSPQVKILDVGKAFGVIIAKNGPQEYEIATFRKDLSGGRRPDAVKFTTIEGDVKRRDFTINALFYDMVTKEIIDLVGGIDDIKNGVIRTVGDPVDRFDEDALRKLRAVRFAAKTGFKYDDKLFDALMEDSSLDGVSTERIKDEFEKIIRCTKNPKKSINDLLVFGFIDIMFPDMVINFPHISSNDFIVQVAHFLYLHSEDDVRRRLNKISYSNKEINDILFLLKLAFFTPQKIFDLKKFQLSTNVSLEQAAVFAAANNIDIDKVLLIFKHKITTKGDDPILKGLEGSEIGKKIREIETKKFEQLLNFGFIKS